MFARKLTSMLFAEGVTLLPSLVLPVSQVVSAPCVVSLWRREMPTLATDGDPGGGVRKLRAPLWRAECHRSPLVRLFLLCPYPCPCCVFLGDSDAKMLWASSPGGRHCADLCCLPCSRSPASLIPVPCPGLVTSAQGPSPSGLIPGARHCPLAAARWRRDAKAEAMRGVRVPPPWPAPIPGLRVAARTRARVWKELRHRRKAALGCAPWPPPSAD